MFSRTAVQVFSPQCGPVRQMATLKAISMRLKAVTNIKKITKSMKMVSAAKYARAERELAPARAYGLGQRKFYELIEANQDEAAPKHMLVALTSDRGLCGAAHSNISRAIRDVIYKRAQGIETKLVCVGDKSRGFLGRLFKGSILMSMNDYGKKPPTFDDAAVVASAIINSDYKYDYAELYFNTFRSVVGYTTAPVPLFNDKAVHSAEKLNSYDSLDEDTMRMYQEFAMVSLVYYAMKESACTEQSQRMTAMDGASKNADEMIGKLTLTYNRTRQAVITRELIEIISGAAAL